MSTVLQPNMTSPMSDRQVYVHMHLYCTLHGSADFRVWSWHGHGYSDVVITKFQVSHDTLCLELIGASLAKLGCSRAAF